MFKRGLLILSAIFTLIVASGAYLLSGNQLSQTVNWILPEDWQVNIPDRIQPSWQRASLAQLDLNYQHCPLLKMEGLTLQWFEKQQFTLEKAVLDYACIAKMPAQEPNNSAQEPLSALLALLPEGEIHIQQLYLVNFPSNYPGYLQAIFSHPTKITANFYQQQLNLSLEHILLNIKSSLKENKLNGELNYQPTINQQHTIQLSAELDTQLLQLPLQLNLDYQWDISDNPNIDKNLQKGTSQLTWQREDNRIQGNWTLQSHVEPENKINLPFLWEENSFSLQQGRVDWTLFPEFPLRGYISAKLTPNKLNLDELFPIKTYLRFSLLSQNEMGKGNIVIENKAGEVRADSLDLALQLTGNIKHGNFVLYSTIPLEFNGNFDDLQLRFLPSALLRVTGKERFLTIQDLRFPLAGIRVNKFGITGRLQAIFKGESPDFKQINLHLDGFANHFKAGLLNTFVDPPQKEAVRDQWQWRFWGGSRAPALGTQIQLNGRGIWHENLVKLTEFDGKLGKISQNSLQIAPAVLQLSEPIQFAYETFQLQGGVIARSPELRFDYGGKFHPLQATLNFNGEVENLNLNGEIAAGEVGPLRLFARRELTAQASRFVGKLYWKEQPLKVFQALLPPRQNWVIKSGYVRGETAFSAGTEQGLVAGGHFAIREGGLSLPSGEIDGVEFALPYQLKNNELDFGIKKPLQVTIREINIGFPIRHVKMQVHGHYPYRKRQPLVLSRLSLELLGGKLNIKRFALPQTKIAYLQLQQIDLEQLFDAVQYRQLELRGKVNATIPFWLNGKPCYVCNGEFTQVSPSSLKFTPEFLEAMKKSGYTEKILLALLNDSRLNQLRAKIHVDSLGDMVLNAQIKTELANQNNAKINLNYRHQENLFELWQVVNYGDQFEQQLEHSIYQKLDKQ